MIFLDAVIQNGDHHALPCYPHVPGGKHVHISIISITVLETNKSCPCHIFSLGFIDRLHVNFDILDILFLLFFRIFFMRRESVIRSVVIIPRG